VESGHDNYYTCEGGKALNTVCCEILSCETISRGRLLTCHNE
jgi:hypothetical protein